MATRKKSPGQNFLTEIKQRLHAAACLNDLEKFHLAPGQGTHRRPILQRKSASVSNELINKSVYKRLGKYNQIKLNQTLTHILPPQCDYDPFKLSIFYEHFYLLSSKSVFLAKRPIKHQI